MKCPKCGGDGVITLSKTDKNGYFNDAFFMKECPVCHGTGEVEQTNEEWLRSCTTEQLAEELLAWWFDGANTYSQFGLYKWEIDKAKEKIMEWLKQPHTAK